VSELGAQELKHQVKLEQWKEQITACRSSGMLGKRDPGCGNEWTCSYAHPDSITVGSTFAEVPVLPAQPFKQAEIVASIHVGKAKVDIYSGADASVVKALCQALKSC
jgi:hypothetical protein